MTGSTLSSRELGMTEGGRSVKPGSLIEMASGTPRRLPRHIPFSVPRDQLYYWTREWQEAEAEADEELRRGEARIFDDPEEALRWLDSPEDE